MVDHTKFQEFDVVMRLYVMSTTNAHRRQKSRPIRTAMSLHSKVLEAVGKAVGDMGEADEVDLAAA